MARISKNTWLGFDKNIQPRRPDMVLVKLLAWERGSYNSKTSTCSYPEPINLTAASAWLEFPKNIPERYSFIYFDEDVNLWVKTMAINEVGLADIDDWCRQEQLQGAMAVWVNRRAEPSRPRPTLNDLDDEPGTMNNGKDFVSLTLRLQQMDKYKIGDCDIINLYPDRFKFKDINNMPEPKKKYKTRAPRAMARGEHSKLAKPVSTPMGVFADAHLAAKKYGVSSNWIASRARKNSQGFYYITKEEYQQRISSINTESIS